MSLQKSFSKKTNLRSPRGYLSLQVRESKQKNHPGWIRINIPASLRTSRKQEYFMLEQQADPEIQAAVHEILNKLNARIHVLHDLDITALSKDELKDFILSQLKGGQQPKSGLVAEIQIDELFSQFIDDQKIERQWSSATIHSYSTSYNKIKALSSKSLSNPKKITNELSNKLEYADYYRTLRRLSACCRWAIKEGKVHGDPFQEILSKLKEPQEADTNPDPFPYKAMQRIIQAYKVHPLHCRYADLIEFLFRTGFRTGEAVALQWGQVNFAKGEILVCKTMTFAGKVHELRNTTKTKKSRRFPLKDPEVIKILRRQWSPGRKDTDFVFQEPEGGHVKRPSLSYSWHGRIKSITLGDGTKESYYTGIVHQLARLPESDGGIDSYRPLYNTRHTYITLVIEKLIATDRNVLGNLAIVADNVGNSPNILLKHYFGRTSDDSLSVIPEGDPSSSSVNNDANQPDDGYSHQVTGKISKLQNTIKSLLQFLAAVIGQFVPESQRSTLEMFAASLFPEYSNTMHKSTSQSSNDAALSEDISECLAWLSYKPNFDD